MNTVTFFVLVGLLFLLLTFWAILDIAQRDFGSFAVKAAWMFTAAMIPFIGCILYLLFGLRMGVKQKETGEPGAEGPKNNI